MAQPYELSPALSQLRDALRPFVGLMVASDGDADDQTINGAGYLGDGPGGYDVICVGHIRALVGAALAAGILNGEIARINLLHRARLASMEMPETGPWLARADWRAKLETYVAGEPSAFSDGASRWLDEASDDAIAEALHHQFPDGQRELDQEGE